MTTGSTALVVPADPTRPVRTVIFTENTLLTVCYRQIGRDYDDAWGRYPRPSDNVRVGRMLGDDNVLLLGDVVITGPADEQGHTLGLDQVAVERLTVLCRAVRT